MTVEQLLNRLPWRIGETKDNYFYLEIFKVENGYIAGYYRDSGKPFSGSHTLHYPTLQEALESLVLPPNTEKE